MNSAEAHSLDNWARRASKSSVFVGEISARSLWSEAQLMECGASLCQVKEMIQVYNGFANQSLAKMDVLASEDCSRLKKIIQCCDFVPVQGENMQQVVNKNC